jgi:hypothetical protein
LHQERVGQLKFIFNGAPQFPFFKFAVIEVVLEATRQYEANYPGFLKKAIVVNTPKVFTILYQLMRPF